MTLIIGNLYRWKHLERKLVYLGKFRGWHQFALADKPHEVWCEVMDCDLFMLEDWA